ncbi:hypothetical protein DRH29_00510 [candidate division Kazan bacterium]|mgnify:CR=1 FL=1|uniref:DUF4105 domain-containing protein n=1 Tax=candidate division Kazan bacterium TaxID=2202143 RepID=A0A420ZDW1_UNCK3|nr:MAG: hypothetical protein DRH29_00510 [candidate division Kazan bacterium]
MRRILKLLLTVFLVLMATSVVSGANLTSSRDARWTTEYRGSELYVKVQYIKVILPDSSRLSDLIEERASVCRKEWRVTLGLNPCYDSEKGGISFHKPEGFLFGVVWPTESDYPYLVSPHLYSLARSQEEDPWLLTLEAFVRRFDEGRKELLPIAEEWLASGDPDTMICGEILKRISETEVFGYMVDFASCPVAEITVPASTQ